MTRRNDILDKALNVPVWMDNDRRQQYIKNNHSNDYELVKLALTNQFDKMDEMLNSPEEKLKSISSLIISLGQIDGSHHKAWVLDQVMRIIKCDKYDEFVDWYEHVDDDGVRQEEKEYDWDCGIAP